jgi:excisionase family DNA binding protein
MDTITDAPAPLAVSVLDAALMLGVGTRTIWSLTAGGRLPSVRIGRRRLYRVEDLRRYLDGATEH